MSAKYAVTEIAHPGLLGLGADCTECLALGRTAAVTARVLGSRSSTYATNYGTGGTQHSATVSRYYALVAQEVPA